ncbi:MAG: Ig-like domain-containing protein, partial [Anaerobutyricum hallii]
GRMNKMYQRLKRKCISLVLFALLVAFIVPYYAYAADNGAEPAAAASAAESTGDFSMSESETSESETSEREETESSEEEEQQTREDADASASTEADVQESTQEQTLTKKERKIVRKNLQLGRSYGFYAWGAEEDAAQGQSDESGVAVQTEAEAEVLSPDIDTVLSKVRSYILSKDTKPDYSSIWNVIGLKRSGLYVPESYINLFYSNVIAYCESKDWQITRAKYSDYSKLILALTAIGVDARNVMGHNLLAYLSDYENVSRQGNNGTIWALIALKSNPAYEIPEDPSAVQQNSEELLVKKVVGMQCQDGGWTLMGTTGDSDMTGMAMQALASYYNKDGYEDVTAAIDKGLAWIEKNQLSSGGFGTMNTETSESVAQIITALCGVGIDCGEDARFIKNGKWPMTGLFQYYMPEGGFMHVAADAGNNGGGAGGIIDGMATEQGLYATVAYRRFLDGETFLYDMSDVAISAGTKPVVSPTIDTGSNSGGNSSSTTAKKTETKPAASKVKVIKVGLNYSTIYLTKGKSKTLKATVSPSNATKKSVKWSSSNKKIATVNAKGKVTGKKAGSAMITVKAKDGSGKKAICKVVVTAPATTAKKNPTTATTRSQTKRVTAPVTSGNSTVSSSVPAASGTTKKLPSGNSGNSAKAATGTTAKKKKTAAEETTGGWSFSGDNYVPDTNSAESEDEVAQEDTETSDTGSKKEGIKWMVIFYIIGGVVVGVLVFVLYKKRHAIAGVLKKFGRGGDTE